MVGRNHDLLDAQLLWICDQKQPTHRVAVQQQDAALPIRTTAANGGAARVLNLEQIAGELIVRASEARSA